MKKTLLALVALGSVIATSQAQLIITGIIDGPRTGGLPKGIEIYVESDVSDLSFWGLESGTNGAVPIAREFSLSGAATAGTYITVASESTGWTAYFGTAPTYTNSAMSINGNDPVYLWYNTGADSVVDLFGVAGLDPAIDTSYNYQDTWWYRVDGATASTTWTASDWFFAPGQSDALDTLGVSGVNPASGDPLHMPLGTFTPVPEPATATMLLGGAGMMFWMIRRKRILS